MIYPPIILKIINGSLSIEGNLEEVSSSQTVNDYAEEPKRIIYKVKSTSIIDFIHEASIIFLKDWPEFYSEYDTAIKCFKSGIDISSLKDRIHIVFNFTDPCILCNKNKDEQMRKPCSKINCYTGRTSFIKDVAILKNE